MTNILIIGATSAIAVACARRWLDMGPVRFHLVGRDRTKLVQVAEDLSGRGAKVCVQVLDLTDFSGHAAMFDAVVADLERIDICLVAHGTLPDQGACERDVALALDEFSSNGLSVISILTLLANVMESQGAGKIGVISSVAGDRGRASNYVYGAAKASVTAFCSGLRARLYRAGVSVTTIKPGFVATPMTRGLPLPAPLVGTPAQVADDIVRAMASGKAVVYTRWFWRWIMAIIKHIPDVVFRRMSF